MKRRIITLFCLNNTDKTELLKKYSIDQTNSTYEKPYVSETDHIHDTIDNTFTEESIVNEKPSNKKYVLIISFLIASSSVDFPPRLTPDITFIRSVS